MVCRSRISATVQASSRGDGRQLSDDGSWPPAGLTTDGGIVRVPRACPCPSTGLGFQIFDQIDLEIPENLLIERSDARGVIDELRASGFRIALDDFGTGYSSLTCLRRFKVDKVKLEDIH